MWLINTTVILLCSRFTLDKYDTIQSKFWSLSDRTLLKGRSTSMMDTPLIMKRRSSSTEGSLWQTISSLPCEWWLFSLFQSCRNHWELNPALSEAWGKPNLCLLNPFQKSDNRLKQVKVECNNFSFWFYHGHVLAMYWYRTKQTLSILFSSQLILNWISYQHKQTIWGNRTGRSNSSFVQLSNVFKNICYMMLYNC